MRTVIFLGLVFVARAINPDREYHESGAVILFIAMMMDVIEFIQKVFFKGGKND